MNAGAPVTALWIPSASAGARAARMAMIRFVTTLRFGAVDTAIDARATEDVGLSTSGPRVRDRLVGATDSSAATSFALSARRNSIWRVVNGRPSRRR